MTNLRLVDPMPKTLDRDAWHKPLVSIIVTHHNYSAHLEDCLRSLLDQTHGNWECVVVDDASDDTQRAIADLTVATMGEPRIRFLTLEANVGQIPAFYAGLDATKGEFVCALDPDDRYGQTFLEEMVAAHLNPIRYCPLIACDQHLLRNNQVITGVQTSHRASPMDGLAFGPRVDHLLRWFPASLPGWHWSTTSSMMFRRPALLAMRPNKTLGYKRQIDAYLAPGAHMLGGSMFLMKALIYRGVHDDNSWQRGDVWGQSQQPKGPVMGAQCRADVIEAIIANGYEGDLARAKQGKRTAIQRWKRSLDKRWRRWTGRAA
jgi:glycosyltransferase involved in cell wall biosynthesis